MSVQRIQLGLQLVLFLIQRISAIPQHLHFAGKSQTPLSQYRVLPSGIQGAHACLEIMLGENLVELGVDLVQRLIVLGKYRLLCQQPVSDGFESGCQGGHETGRGLIVNGLLPLARILPWRRLVEGDARLVDFVVEVVLEYRVRVLRVPFVPYALNLLCDGFLVCGRDVRLVLAVPEVRLDKLTLRRFAARLPNQTGAQGLRCLACA